MVRRQATGTRIKESKMKQCLTGNQGSRSMRTASTGGDTVLAASKSGGSAIKETIREALVENSVTGNSAEIEILAEIEALAETEVSIGIRVLVERESLVRSESSVARGGLVEREALGRRRRSPRMILTACFSVRARAAPDKDRPAGAAANLAAPIVLSGHLARRTMGVRNSKRDASGTEAFSRTLVNPNIVNVFGIIKTGSLF